MKIFLLIWIGVLLILQSNAQSNNTPVLAFASSMQTVNRDFKWPDTRQEVHLYSQQTIDKKLRRSRACIISGAVFTGIGGVIFLGGCGYAIWSTQRPIQPGPKTGDPTAVIIWSMAMPELTVGIPLVTIGAVQHRKWMKIEQQIDVHAGVMSNGHAGLVMNF